MFANISWPQLLIILVIVLAIFGTKRLRTLGSDLGSAAIDGAVAAALAAIEPAADNRGPVEFKKHLAGVILKRAIARAASRAA